MGRWPAKLLSGVGVIGMLVFLPAAGAGAAPAVTTCTGTFSSPGTLSGTFSNVVVNGICAVDDGPATVTGNLVISPNGGLDATFSSPNTLEVDGNIVVSKNGILGLGCEASASPCEDDDPNNPTLNGPATVRGSILASGALALIVHNVSIGGSVAQLGGGGGVNCDAGPGPLSFGVFSAWEDDTVGGTLSISGVGSCWMGVIRNSVGGNVALIGNQLADPDAIEVESNTIGVNLVCTGNSQVWDSAENPSPDNPDSIFPRVTQANTVAGARIGQCNRSTPDDSPTGTPGPPNSF